MSASTNSLVAKARKFALPAALAGGLILSTTFFLGHNPVHAASAAGPIDEQSVSSLTSLDNAVEAVAARVTPAVVNVSVTSRGSAEQEQGGEGDDRAQNPFGSLPPGLQQFFGNPGQGHGQHMQPQTQIEHGIGSGIIVSPDGYIVTNNHVIDGAMEIRVTLNDRRVLKAKLIGADKLTDLAVIKVNATNLRASPGETRTNCIPVRPCWPLAARSATSSSPSRAASSAP